MAEFRVIYSDREFYFKNAKHAAIFFAYLREYENIVNFEKIGTIGQEEQDLLI